MRRSARSHIRGSVIITITLIGMFLMLLSAALVNHFAVAESREVEQSLAKVRIYWAAMGHIDYALSRARRQGNCALLCTQPSDENVADWVVNLGSFLDELFPDADAWRVWKYEDAKYGDNYTLSFKHVVNLRLDSFGNPDDILTLSIEFCDQGTIPALSEMRDRIRDLRVDVCLGGGPCPASPNPAGGSGASTIDRLLRVGPSVAPAPPTDPCQ